MKLAIRLSEHANDQLAQARAANADGIVVAADDATLLNREIGFDNLAIASLELTRALVGPRSGYTNELRRGAESVVDAAPAGAAVVITSPPLQRGGAAERCHSQMLAALGELCDRASPRGVRIAVLGSGQLRDTAALWRLRDAVQQPTLRVVYDVAQSADPPTLAIKRLGRMLHEVRLPAAWCAANAPEGAELSRLIDLLRGIAYDAWITIVPPDGAWDAAGAVARLRELIAAPVVPLTAYKGDRNAPRFVRPAAKETA